MKNIGIVTAWFERGAGYVSYTYMSLLQKEGYNVFVYARGGEEDGKKDEKWNLPFVTWEKKKSLAARTSTQISERDFYKWIRENHIDLLLFNDQRAYDIVILTRKHFPDIPLVSYVDYYTEGILKTYLIYDALICNTHRHMQAMDFHPQSYYLKWGTDLEVYKPIRENHDQVTFFHSAGMSVRKGTEILIKAYIGAELYKNSKLIIHTQLPIEKVSDGYSKDDLGKYGIEVIQKTVSAPGLYHLGDVYVYPTRLDGLGLTMYEALACGMPVIATDYPPMNEVINDNVGSLVKLERNYCRFDAYYWPMSICDTDDLALKMKEYIDNRDLINTKGKRAREESEKQYDIFGRSNELKEIIENIHTIPHDKVFDSNTLRKEKVALKVERSKIRMGQFYHFFKK